jgi:hypothetical protein
MPVLIVEHDEASSQLCSLLAPDIPNLFLLVDEFVNFCVPNPTTFATATTDAFHQWMGHACGINGIDCHCPFEEIRHCVSWLRAMLHVSFRFAELWPDFCCMLFLIPVPLIDFVCDGFFSELADALPKLQSQWQICCGVTSCSMFGDVVSAPRWFLCGIRQRHGCTHNLTFPPVVSESRP